MFHEQLLCKLLTFQTARNQLMSFLLMPGVMFLLMLSTATPSTCVSSVQVATEWLFSVPQDVLDKHVSSDPNTPTHDEDRHQEKPVEEKRVTAPRRVPLQACHSGSPSIIQCNPGSFMFQRADKSRSPFTHWLQHTHTVMHYARRLETHQRLACRSSRWSQWLLLPGELSWHAPAHSCSVTRSSNA